MSEKFIKRTEKRLAGRLKKIFEKQKGWIISGLFNLDFLEKKENNFVFKKNTSEHDVDIFLLGLPGTSEIADELKTAESSAIKKAAESQIRLMKLAKFGISFSLDHPDAVRYLSVKHTLEKLSNYRGNIDGGTKTKIREILVEGISKGTSYSELARQIREQGEAGVFSQARGELIATREMGFAYSSGSRIPVDDFSRKFPDVEIKKKWQTVNDGAVRETHSQNEDDGWIPLHQSHSGTGEDKAPSDDFGCRCTEVYSSD